MSQRDPEWSKREAPGYPPQVVDDDIGGLDLRDLLRKLWRRKGLIFAIAAIGFTVAAVQIFQIVPRYTAHAQVRIDSPRARVVDIDQVTQGPSRINFAVLEGEMHVLKSRDLGRRVVDKLALDEDPEFNPYLRVPDEGFRLADWLDPRRWWAEIWSSRAGSAEAAISEKGPELPDPEILEQIIVDAVLARLDVRPEGESYVIRISATSTHPRTAAKLANAVADLYLVSQLEAKFEATERATRWLNSRLEGLREEVEAAERAVEDYRAQTNLLKGEGSSTLASEQISQLNSQLIIARTERSTAASRLNQLQRLLDRGGIEAASEVVQSTLIGSLNEQLSGLTQSAAELSEEYGAKHPRMVRIRAEINDVRGQIKQEVRKIVQQRRNDVNVAAARERALESNLERLKSEIGSLNQESVQLRTLEREAEARRALFETFLKRFQETSVQGDLQQADAQIVSQAKVPRGPSYPNRSRMLLMAALLATAAGVAIAFLVEFLLDRGFRSMDQIEGSLGVPALGLLPTISGALKRTKPEAHVLEKPTSAYSEALRQVHASLLLSDVDHPPQVVMVTSSVPREGKTTTSTSLARLLAKAGHKVLLIDADLRRGTCYRHLALNQQPGLVDILSHDQHAGEAVQLDEASGLHFIATGRDVRNAQDILSSHAIERLLKRFKTLYDLILIDSPPVTVVSDARFLAPRVDKILFVTKWNDTRRDIVATSLKKLREGQADIAGVVLSQVDVRQHAKYGYSDSGYYHGRYASYYSD